MATTRRHDVKDLGLAEEGVRRIEWADRNMPPQSCRPFTKRRELSRHDSPSCSPVRIGNQWPSRWY